MAGGKLWQPDEDDLILRLVAAGKTNAEIAAVFNEKFPARRTIASLRKRRHDLSLLDALPEPDNKVKYAEDEDALHVSVVSVGEIKTIDDLRKAADVDLDVWDEYKADVRNRYAPMKDEFGRIVAVEIRYIKIEYRRTAESRFDLTPAIVKIVKPRIPTPRKSTADTSVHWSDIHFPHHDDRALSILHQVISMVDPVVVVDHGDTLDAEQLGRWAKNPLARVSLKEEIHMGINHFGEVTSLVRQDCRKIWLEGNHEERKRRIVWDLADNRAYGELVTLPHVMEALTWSNLLGLQSLGWEDYPYVSDAKRANRVTLFGKLICKHGKATGKNVAQKEYLKFMKSGISGHCHRLDVHVARSSYDGDQHQWTVMPMMGAIREDYTDAPQWGQGFVVVTWSKDRQRFAKDVVQIIDGECWFRGVHLKG